jgi:diguanylate cyclase (GGDEF)-like protein
VSFAKQAMNVYDHAHAIENRLSYQSEHDPLTALPNRLLLLSRVEQVLRDSRRDESSPALILLDLDGFKVINDSLGHRAGDLVLREVAGRLVRVVSSTDTVARIDGDEFVVMLRQPPNETGLIDVARRLRDAVSTPIMVDGHEVVLTASVGIARADPADAAEDLLRDAAAATHRVKSRGKNDHELFTEDVRRWAVDHVGTEADLRQGLRDNRFVLHHQPIVELASGHLAGVESLVRMRHPQRGLLGPGEFIHVAEDSGLIVPIGRWVLEQSCRELTRWKAGGACPPHLYVSVNLSAAQAARPELVETVGRALAGSGLEAGSLALELTESALIEADTNTQRRLHDLRDIGVRLGIDDFGTGYSSLTYLKNLPVTFVKIDRSFVSGVVEDSADRQIVTAVIRLAQGLGLSTIAEGVETADQLALLRELGCQYAQGYLLGRPQPGPPDRLALSRSRRA